MVLHLAHTLTFFLIFTNISSYYLYVYWSVYVSVLFQVFDTTRISECPREKIKVIGCQSPQKDEGGHDCKKNGISVLW